MYNETQGHIHTSNVDVKSKSIIYSKCATVA